MGVAQAVILVVNCGSSTLKYRLFDGQPRCLGEGLIERIGEGTSRHVHHDVVGGVRTERRVDTPDHASAFRHMASALGKPPLRAVGHRVVHGGGSFSATVRIDPTVLAEIERLALLAPLHNPANALGIRLAQATWPGVPQFAAFDTAFHHGLPEHVWRYAVPETWWREHGVRRYGFHGLSHAFVADRAAEILRRPLHELRLISLHLGNGASACAIAGGRSVETSMGFTPLEGLVMGTRSGDLDPAIPLYIERATGMGYSALEDILNHGCGLVALAGSQDMRDCLERAAAGEARARLALDVYCHRVRKYIGAYFAVLGGLDALVFTAGVGENAAPIRARIVSALGVLGLELDPARNEAPIGEWADIATPGSPARILVIRTDEERRIAQDILDFL